MPGLNIPPYFQAAASLPTPDTTATIAQGLIAFPQYSGVSDTWGNVGNFSYNSLPGHRAAASGTRPHLQLQLHLGTQRWRRRSVPHRLCSSLWFNLGIHSVLEDESHRSQRNHCRGAEQLSISSAYGSFPSAAVTVWAAATASSVRWSADGSSPASTPMDPVRPSPSPPACAVPPTLRCRVSACPTSSPTQPMHASMEATARPPAEPAPAISESDLAAPRSSTSIPRSSRSQTNISRRPARSTSSATRRAPRRSPYGPGNQDLDAALRKSFNLPKEIGTFVFEVDCINVWNKVTFSNPASTFGNANFGQISSVSGTPGIPRLPVRRTHQLLDPAGVRASNQWTLDEVCASSRAHFRRTVRHDLRAPKASPHEFPAAKWSLREPQLKRRRFLFGL